MNVRSGSVLVAAICLTAITGTAQAACIGDCDADGVVAVNELITGVNIALGAADVSTCAVFDDDANGEVTVNELISGVNNALTGCSVVGAECGNGTMEGDEACDDGNTDGGDGCAANCTLERRATCTLGEGALARVQTTLFAVPINLSGQNVITAGHARGSNGEIPVVIRAEDMVFDPVQVPGLVCACVRGVPQAEFGPNLTAVGTLGCGSNGLSDVDYVATRDHNTNDVDPNCDNGTLEDGTETQPHAGTCNGEPQFAFTGGGLTGSVFMRAAAGISLVADGGSCIPNCGLEDNGPDCMPCTADDLNQAEGSSLPLTTGTAEGVILDASNRLGTNVDSSSRCGGGTCETKVTGVVVDCSLLDSDPNAAMSGASLVGALPAIDVATLGDNVVTAQFVCE